MKLRKRTLVLTLAFILGANTFAPLALSATSNIPLLKNTYEQDPNNQQAAYDYALALARNGQYPFAIAIFHELSINNTNPNILYDYAVVLAWSGDYPAAISLYEDQILPLKAAIPTYVKTSIAGAYYHLGKFKEAQLLFHDGTLAGDRQAKRWEAESFIQMQDILSGNRLYHELLTENQNDVATYLSRASMFILMGNTTSAAVDINKALELLPNDPAGNEQRRQIRSDMAIPFIQNGDYSNGIILLQPSITDGSSTMKMQANYILALRINADYKVAIHQALLLWSDHLTSVPDFGLQSLADCYLRIQQPQKAADIYHIILTRNNKDTNLTTIKLSLAYADLQLGNLQAGLELYNQVLSTNPKLGTVVSGDADAFIGAGHFYAGKQLYELLLNKFPANPFYLKSYAAILAAKDMPRAAYHQYDMVSQLKNGDLVGLSGIVNTAIAVGDYKTAASAKKSLEEKYPRNLIAGQSIRKYENRNQNNLYAYSEVTQDYKGNDLKTIELSTSQHNDGRFSILVDTIHKKIIDRDSSVTLNSYGLGLQYQDINRDATLWINNYHQSGMFTGYRLLTNHYFDDRAFIGINIEKKPVEDVQALVYPIMSTSQEINFTRKLGLKNLYTLAFTSANYSDGNHSTTYATTFDHTMVATQNKNINWFTYLNRTNYKYQEIRGTPTPYESPLVRETYGAGIKERWSGLKSYCEATVRAEWGRDRPESFGFSPSIALEYGYNFSQTKALVIGAEYGLRTDTISSSKNLGFGTRQYHINYHMTW